MKHHVTLITALALATHLAPAADWNQWRGPNRDGQFPGAAWPGKIDTNTLQKTWSAPLDPSYSGPVVSGDRIFTTQTKEKKFEEAIAYDRHTGKELWKARWEGALSVPFFAKANGDWIRATPACDGESLYVAGMRDVLVCLDVATGKERWRFDFVQKLEAPVPDFGFVCSPLVDASAVYVQAGASFVKLNKHTGEVIWRTLKNKGGMLGSAFSSPVMETVAGKPQLLVLMRDKVAGVDPDNGNVLWEQAITAFQGMNILTPVVYKDILFTSTYGGKTIGYKITRNGDKYEVKEAWQHKAQGYMTTPVVVDGVAYSHLKSQRIMAIDLESGKEYWTSDKSYGKYWSLVAQGNRILALDETGILFLFQASRDRFNLLDQRRLTDKETWAHLAVQDDEIYVRELNALTAYRWVKP